MNKLDYLFAALNAGAYRKKSWALSVFSVTQGPEERYPYALLRTEKNTVFVDPENPENLITIDDAQPQEPLFRFTDRVDITPALVPNCKKAMNVPVGNVFFNFYVLVYALGDRIEFMTGKLTPGAVQNKIRPLMADYPENGERDPKLIYPDDYRKFNKAIFGISGFTQLCVPSATKRMLTTHPDARKLRAELLEKNKDRLWDPAVIAKMEAELIALDKEWMKSDPDGGDGFFVKENKSYGVVRKRMHLMHGAEMGFQDGTKATLVVNSLNEGWDVDKMPDMINSLREGSYNRGRDTALGGEAVKFLGRVFQNTTITEQDCGSKLGWEKEFTEHNFKKFVGFYRVTPQGSEEITEDYAKSQIGKKVTVRSPMLCKTPKTGFCQRCMGNPNAINPTALGLLAADLGSQMMYIFMGAMHGKVLSVASYDFKKSVT